MIKLPDPPAALAFHPKTQPGGRGCQGSAPSQDDRDGVRFGSPQWTRRDSRRDREYSSGAGNLDPVFVFHALVAASLFVAGLFLIAKGLGETANAMR